MTRETLSEIVRFAFVGALVMGFHIALVFILTGLLMWWYLVSVTVSYALAIVLNFLLQKYYVRRNTDVSVFGRQFTGFLALSIGCLLANTALSYFLVNILGWHYIPAQIVIVGVLTAVTFTVNRHVIFR